jgi:hypothetical protein
VPSPADGFEKTNTDVQTKSCFRRERRTSTELIGTNEKRVYIDEKFVRPEEEARKTPVNRMSEAWDWRRARTSFGYVEANNEEKEMENKRKNEKAMLNMMKESRRRSTISNGSVSSMFAAEAQFEMLSDLTKSVRELNQRLIKSEEVTYERLVENIKIKETIKALENKLEDQKSLKIETCGNSTSCSPGCSLF